MPSIVDEFGIGVDPVGAVELTAEQVARTVDLFIVQFRARGVRFADIGRIMNRPRTTVQGRYYAMTDEARGHYASVTLG